MVRRPAGNYSPPSKAVAKLIDRITKALRAYLDQGGTRTDLLHAVGNDVAELRSLFTRNDAPDWSGRSREYQHAMSEVYDRLNVPAGKRRDALQFAVRFHAGNAIRERADTAELEAAGLTSVSPKDRIQNRRDALAAVAGAAGVQAGASESLPKVVAWAAMLLEYADGLDAGPLIPEERAAVRALARDIRKSLKALEARL